MRSPSRLLALGVVASLTLAGPEARAVSLPPQFVVENAVPGITFDIPTAVAFLPGGRMLVAEKRGRVWVVANGVRHPVPLWSREGEVLNETDRGLLSVAVDPDYPTNHHIYLLYTVDPDSNGVDNNADGFGRLTRYQVSFADSNALDPASRTILFGTDWRDGPLVASPTHSVGDLQWGADGSLLVSTGEGAEYFGVDAGGRDPGLFGPQGPDPIEDIGAFRAQYLGSLAGKILRIHPGNGHGYPSNPWWDGDGASVRSRVWCYGLRNPFRFAVRPGSGSPDPMDGDPGTIYLGEVGWDDWEEQNVAPQGGRNFGWPCHEGPAPQPDYQAADPIHHGCDSLGLGDDTGTLTPPALWYHHADPSLGVPPGYAGNTAVGGAFYTAATYPALYQGRYFFADYERSWIRLAEVDASDSILSVSLFAGSADGPVDLATDPVSGDLHYVAILAGEVRRIRWAGPLGSNNPPVAAAAGTPVFGVSPLTVSFSSGGTYDPDLDPLTITWNFGDGVGSGAADPVHTYLAGGTYFAVVTADDGSGGIARDTVTVTVYGGAGPFPSTLVLDDFDRADGPLGGAWAGETAGAVIEGQAATTLCCDVAPVWGGEAWGAQQEAYLTLAAVGQGYGSVLLKVQGMDRSVGYLEVGYDGAVGRVVLNTFASGQGLVARGEFPGAFAEGDRLGARAWSNGSIEVFRNAVRIGTASAGDWPFAASGGRLGFVLDSDPPARIDDFGGGDIVQNTAPTATILSPPDHSFFVEGDVLTLWGRARDTEQLPGTLDYEWRLDLHHGSHVHPGAFQTGGTNASYPIPAHEDGNGVWYEIEFRVVDAEGLADTARTSVFPEVDLVARPVQVAPSEPGTTAPAEYRFTIANAGRMPTPTSRWRLVSGGVMLAEGDAQVAALDSVVVVVTVPPLLPAGDHTLRLVVDTLGAVVETDEGNNAETRSITVVEGPGTVGSPGPGVPAALALSSAYPTPAGGTVSFALELPRASRVGFAVLDLQGRQVWRQPDRVYEAGRRVLGWDGGRPGGGRAPPGLYLARVTVDGRALVRRIIRIR